MGSKRNERLKELFLQEINQALRNVNGINANGILTLTGSELTRDSKIFYVYYSVLGTDAERRRKEIILKANARDVRTLLFERLCIKDIPELIFKFDETPGKAAHIEYIQADTLRMTNPMRTLDLETEFKRLEELIASSRLFLSGHLNPDGDYRLHAGHRLGA